jgi:hypothetical protein
VQIYYYNCRFRTKWFLVVHSTYIFIKCYFWTRAFRTCKKINRNYQNGPKILQKSLTFMHPKSTQRSLDHQKLGTRKNGWRSPKINQNYFKSTPKNVEKKTVFKHGKMAFYFWTRPTDTCKNHWTKTQKGHETIKKDPKSFKMPQLFDTLRYKYRTTFCLLS